MQVWIREETIPARPSLKWLIKNDLRTGGAFVAGRDFWIFRDRAWLPWTILPAGFRFGDLPLIEFQVIVQHDPPAFDPLRERPITFAAHQHAARTGRLCTFDELLHRLPALSVRQRLPGSAIGIDVETGRTHGDPLDPVESLDGG